MDRVIATLLIYK